MTTRETISPRGVLIQTPTPLTWVSYQTQPTPYHPLLYPNPLKHIPSPSNLNAALDHIHGIHGEPGDLTADAACRQVLHVGVLSVFAPRRPHPLDRLVHHIVARHARHVASLIMVRGWW